MSKSTLLKVNTFDNNEDNNDFNTENFNDSIKDIQAVTIYN